MVLVDTSSWIHFLRPDGDRDVRARVESALRAGTARWCPLVRLELWNGAGGEREKKVLREFERVLPELAIDDAVWSGARDLARRCRAAGVTAPATHPDRGVRTTPRRAGGTRRRRLRRDRARARPRRGAAVHEGHPFDR